VMDDIITLNTEYEVDVKVHRGRMCSRSLSTSTLRASMMRT
jgi:hypothetical protein